MMANDPQSMETRDGAGDGAGDGQRHASAWHTVKTIAWSFFGVRRQGDHEQEGAGINPVHVLIAGFVGVFLLVAGLIVLVRWVAL